MVLCFLYRFPSRSRLSPAFTKRLSNFQRNWAQPIRHNNQLQV